jgi:hypothetical protein
MSGIFSSLKPLYYFFTKNDKPCIDKTKNPNAICTKEHRPVKGCDNKVYSNICLAKAAGVLTWQPYNNQYNNQYDRQPNNQYNTQLYPKKQGCGCGK